MDKTKNITHTEALILEAARNVFLKKGLEGARMQEIADEAGINKALLHYYFRSKEKLFEQIFENALQGIFDTINANIHEEQDIYAFITLFVKEYIRVIRDNPFIPNFILNEINRNPERIRKLASFIRLNIAAFSRMIEKNIREKKMIRMAPEHLLIDMLSMSIFPIVARPLVQSSLFNENETAFQNFLDERSNHIISFFRVVLNPNQNNKINE